MGQIPKNKESQVFEMLLQTAGEAPSRAVAQPSSFELPQNWHEEHMEGQLAIDVGQTDTEVILVTTMAGAMADKMEVYIHNDLLTVRGMRHSPIEELPGVDMFHQECFWGKFSRTIVLPVDVKGDMAKAEYKNGILTIKIPKQKTDTKIEVVVVDD
ncbi:MAG: Hsp20/alpha crystallin family protein [Candidatus Magasanikbacteria bacterium]|jgi:HSP20 family protein|nr:Hsp20/alpha crystallin family protein [Candidatus Magasanikbacteria bacterium]MBT4314532.1 Hsp20/alpha crystallin family protein [Candidatus Magasanikbacteria bacterium]MBT4547634.1 Hsp20/alpha crystallin family protein [Candidatus Magasanikbacteria bacterium]MBT6819303.1 Hsp20/alpha crystallin family protein [Candidatus Magasanikbacteria bacterium]